jgi:predicted nucleotidyltransferase
MRAAVYRNPPPARRRRETYNAAVDRADLERRMQGVLRSAPPEVLATYLYGSRARGTASAASDVDVGLLLRSVPVPKLRSLALELEGSVERAVGVPVEVVVLNTAPADLVHRVLRDGVLLLDRDRAARLRFEVQSRNEYFDLEPIRRLYRRPA